MSDAPLHLRFDAQSHPNPAARTAAWQDAMSLSADAAMTPGQAEAFSARMSFYPIGPALLVDARCTPHTLVRSRQTIARSGDAHVLIDVFLSGGFRGVLGGRSLSVGPGDCFMMDFGRTMRVDVAESRFIGFMIPRAQFAAHGRAARSIHGLRLPAGSPEAEVLGTMLASLAAQASALSLPRRAALGLGVTGLIAACVDDRPRQDPRERSSTPASGARPAQIRRYIERHAADPELGPDRVGAAFGLSRAALYRVFRSEGGVAHAIRHRRADLAHGLLGAADAEGRSIDAIARASGFANARALARALRDHHGTSPTQLRRTRGDTAAADPSQATRHSIEIGAMIDATEA